MVSGIGNEILALAVSGVRNCGAVLRSVAAERRMKKPRLCDEAKIGKSDRTNIKTFYVFGRFVANISFSCFKEPLSFHSNFLSCADVAAFDSVDFSEFFNGGAVSFGDVDECVAVLDGDGGRA